MSTQVELGNLLTQVKEAMTGGFDASDIDYLVLHFDSSELRRLAHTSECEAAACRTLGENGEEAYWEELGRACRSALDTRLGLEAVSKPKTHHGKRLDPEAIKGHVDLVVIVEQYTQLRKSGRNLVGLCPLHDDRHPSFTVYPEKQSWRCFGCNKGGDVITFIMATENLDFGAALARLAGSKG